MSRGKTIKDSFALGFFSGTVCLVVFFYLFTLIRSMIIQSSGDIHMLRPPAVQLFTMVLNVVLFRIIMINLNREKTAKGFLFITVIASLVYFFIFYRLNK